MTGVRSSQRSARLTVLRACAVAVAAVFVTACEQAADERADLCARVVPALHTDHPAADILTVEHEPPRRAVHLTYRLKGGIDGGRLHWIKCIFSPEDETTVWPNIEAVDTDQGSVGEGRLFVIRRWWFDDAEHAQKVGQGRSRSSFQRNAMLSPGLATG